MASSPLTQSLCSGPDDGLYQDRTIYGTMQDRLADSADDYALTEILADGSVGRRWTYRQLHDDAVKLGKALAARHDRGAKFTVFAHNVPEWILLELAGAYAGLILVTANPALGANELRYILEQSKSEAVYYTPLVRGSDLAKTAAEAAAGLERVTTLIDMTDHDALFDGYDRGELRETKPDDPVQIQYTSGTTGFPKGALLHQKGLVQNGHDILSRDLVKKGYRLMHHMPMFHTSGCAILVLGSISMGCELLLPPAFDPNMICDVIEREKPEFSGCVPTMLVALTEVAGTRDLSSIQSILCGGAMVSPELCRAAKDVFGCPVLIIYGQTEASPGITGALPDDTEEDMTGTVGKPYPHMDVAILDTGDQHIIPIGEQGEIAVRGYNVMNGYNDNPEATAKAITQDGWLLTGDLGRMDDRGYVRVTGRVKEMIIRGGENLFPAEIENAMLEHPGVAEVAVVGVPDPKWGELVACFMRPASGEKPTPQDLKAHMRDRLSPQKTPAYWIWVDDWPLTGSGKIRKFELSEQFQRGEHQAETA